MHEDRGLISYDHSRDKYVFRQFHTEGFVNLTYKIIDDDEYMATFDLAPEEKEFSCYIENRFKRKPNP